MLVFLTPFSLWAQHSLEVRVEGVESQEGTIQVALFTSREGFLKNSEAYRTASAEARKGSTHLVFENLPAGTYALAVFHDRNDNSKLDTNWLGIPKEPMGFSNAGMKAFGPPSFEDCHLNVRGDFRITVNLE